MNFDTILRRVSSEKELLPDETLVMIDSKKGKALEKAPAFWQLVKVSYYAVSTIRTVSCAGINYRFGDALLKISYKVNCIIDREAEAVEALLKEDSVNPEDTLNNRIRRIVKRYADENQYHDTIPRSMDDLKNYIKKTANSELALNLIPAIVIDGEKSIDQIHTDTFEIRIEEAAIAVSFELEYETVDWNKKTANPDEYLSLQRNMIEMVKEFALREASLHQWVYSFDENIKPLLTKKVEDKLSRIGLRTRYFKFNNETSRTIGPKEITAKISTKLNCKIEEYNELIQVHVEVRLKLTDLGKYKKAGISGDFNTWYENKIIVPIIEAKLFTMTYRNFLLRISKIREEIVSEIEEQTRRIGYHVEYQLFFPDIPKLRFVEEGFKFEDISGDFKTKDNRVKIPLYITVKGKIGNLTNVEERYLNPNVDLEAEIKNSVVAAVADVMYKVDAEEAYMRFEFNNEGPTVREKAVKAVTTLLKEKFDVMNDSMTVLIDPGESYLTSKVNTLMANDYRFAVSFIPAESGLRVLPLDYSFTFRILGVLPDGWVKFQTYGKRSVDAEIESIKNLLEERVTDILKQIEYDMHVSERRDNKEDIRKKVERTFFEVGSEFGLILEVAFSGRDVTVLVKTIVDMNLEKIKEEALRIQVSSAEEIELSLEKARLELVRKIGEGRDEEELTGVRERIERLETMQKTHHDSSNMLLDHRRKQSKINPNQISENAKDKDDE